MRCSLTHRACLSCRSTYNELYNQTSPAACLPCPAGRSSQQVSTNKTTDCFFCGPSEYCEPLNICPNGFTCGGNTTQQIPCPQGRYGAAVSTSAACSGPCEAGNVLSLAGCFVCPSWCARFAFARVLLGYYDQQGGQSAPTCSGACPAGYWYLILRVCVFQLCF